MRFEQLSKAIYYMDDFKRFKKIQVSKYVSSKKGILKKQTPEWDIINDLIQECWCDLLSSGFLNSKSDDEKSYIFDSVTIIFPYTEIPDQWTDGITYVDFASF